MIIHHNQDSIEKIKKDSKFNVMMEENIEDFLSVGVRAVKEAGKIILEFQDSFTVKIFLKAVGSLFTNADLEAEKKVVEIIGSNFPDHKIFGEELGFQNKDSKTSFTWTIDPIDGTSAFINKEFTACVNLSLLKDNIAVLGIIYNPFTSELFTTSIVTLEKWEY